MSSDGKEISDMFAHYFSSIYNKQSSLTLPDNIYKMNSIDASSVHLSVDNILKGIHMLNVNKGAGPDGIPPMLIKHCCNSLSYPLFIIFNKSLSKGIFPDVWKLCDVVPVFKSGDKSDIKNYRPITLQSCLPKLFEGIVLKILSPTIDSIIIPEQHGFLKGRSTLTNLLLYQKYIVEAFNKKLQVDAIYTDYSKAFDVVDLVLLIHKLFLLGFRDPLLSWFASFLQNRRLRVKFLNFFSMVYNAISGVPQGSHFGPKFFLLFINDLSVDLTALISILADDVKIFLEIRNVTDCFKLQDDLNKISDWSSRNNMNLNISKCKCITFSRIDNSIIFDYRLNGTPLERVSHIRDLGVILDSKMHFEMHVETIKNKSLKMLGFICRNTNNFTNPKSLITLYNSYVRTHLEYLSVIWSPHTQYLSEMVEKVQKKFKRILSFRFNTDEVDIPDLSVRRVQSDIIVLFNIIHGHIDSPELLSLIKFHVPPYPVRHVPVFDIEMASTNFYLNLPLSRMQREANELQIDIFFCRKKDLRVKNNIREK